MERDQPERNADMEALFAQRAFSEGPWGSRWGSYKGDGSQDEHVLYQETERAAFESNERAWSSIRD